VLWRNAITCRGEGGHTTAAPCHDAQEGGGGILLFLFIHQHMRAVSVVAGMHSWLCTLALLDCWLLVCHLTHHLCSSHCCSPAPLRPCRVPHLRVCLPPTGAARHPVCAAHDPAECGAPPPHGAAPRALPGRLPGPHQPAAVAALQGGRAARVCVCFQRLGGGGGGRREGQGNLQGQDGDGQAARRSVLRCVEEGAAAPEGTCQAQA
jgi:hypothetical protein